MTIILTTLSIALVMIIFEIFAPGRSWQKVSGWWTRAIALNACQVGSVFLAGMAWDKWMIGRSLWNMSEMVNIWGSAIIGYLVITFIYYWWHLARHKSYFLWRWLHQIHHSPQRLEIITSFYKHPFEIVINSILSSFILYMMLGLDPKAASLAILMTGMAELFYHWNVKTPYWLGFILQRPESHCVHHQQGVHNNNFSDLPIWDMLFGTFHNPRSFDKKCGFSDHKEAKIITMLCGFNVNKSHK